MIDSRLILSIALMLFISLFSCEDPFDRNVSLNSSKEVVYYLDINSLPTDNYGNPLLYVKDWEKADIIIFIDEEDLKVLTNNESHIQEYK